MNIAIGKVRQLVRRSKVVDCPDEGAEVRLVAKPPAPQPHDVYHYSSMIDRLRGLYDTRFAQV